MWRAIRDAWREYWVFVAAPLAILALGVAAYLLWFAPEAASPDGGLVYPVF